MLALHCIYGSTPAATLDGSTDSCDALLVLRTGSQCGEQWTEQDCQELPTSRSLGW